MRIMKTSMMLLSTLSLAVLLSACGSSSKEGSNIDNVAKIGEGQCRVCHAASIDPVSKTAILPEYLISAHYEASKESNEETGGCQGCHGGGAQHNGVGPIPFKNPLASNRCILCHTTATAALFAKAADDFKGICTPCHTSANTVGLHGILPHSDDCIGCHDVGLSAPAHRSATIVNDNNGVRAIVGEFSKRSHHITGAAPTNAQCVVCHLEGKVVAGAVVLDNTKHMVDASIHLRNADTNADYVWDGVDHTAMDNFCFSCHDSNGATAVPATFAGVTGFTGTAMNPFGDTLTNGYDQVARAGVVDVKTAFTTTNASHHAVSGQKYKYRFSTLANATAWATANGKPVPAASEIAEGHTDLDGNPIPATAFDSMNSAGNVGEAYGLEDRTLYEADKFVASYIPLGATANVADNSTLHCGDCHTVGQWKVGSSTNADGSSTPVAIGAHGSANDYLLRNSLGTDALHSSQTYVCFNCHKGSTILVANNELWAELVADGEINSTVVKPTWRAGWGAQHPNVIAGQLHGGYDTTHAVSAFHAQCLVDSSIQVGSAGTPALPVLSRVWHSNGGGHKDRNLDFTPAPGATAAYPTTAGEGGNITGIACTNCHNSALRQGWGGIHGGDNTYTDGMGRTQKSYRFMPGMGNYRYAPPGGWDGKDVSDPRAVTLPGAGVGAGKPMGGCYTNATADANNGFSSCAHHGTSTAAIPAGIIAATPTGTRTTLGGGTSSNATAAEPTVREATAGNALVTRPLKY